MGFVHCVPLKKIRIAEVALKQIDDKNLTTYILFNACIM